MVENTFEFDDYPGEIISVDDPDSERRYFAVTLLAARIQQFNPPSFAIDDEIERAVAIAGKLIRKLDETNPHSNCPGDDHAH